jgi:hypothetical protein
MICKNTKIAFFIYEPYECTAVEEYLEQMAEKGWLLQSVKGPLFKFTKIKPKKIKYSVDVLSKVSIFDHKDTDVALEYREYCQAAGWTYVCQTGKIQIFYTEEASKTISIHTDEEEKFKAVFSASLYNIISLLFITLMLIFNIYNDLFKCSTEFLLSSNYMIILTLIMFFFIFINIIKLSSFSLWVIKARLKLKENKFMPYNTYKQLSIKNIFIKFYSLFAIMFLIFGNTINEKSTILLLLSVFIPIIILICVQIFINRKQYSKNTNIVITITSSLASIFLVFVFIVGTAICSINLIHQNKEPNEKASLTLTDFNRKVNNAESPNIDFNISLIANSTRYSYGSYLSYSILQSQYPEVIKFHEDRLLSRLISYGIDLKRRNTNLPNNIRVYSDSEKRSYILVSEDKVVDIKKDFSDISDDDFLNTVYKKLF